MHTTTTRKTSIVATVGPASTSKEALVGLIDAGVDMFRISASHDPVDVVVDRIARARATSASIDADVAVMVDLCGPKLRCVPSQETTAVAAGERWQFTSGAPSRASVYSVGSTVPAHVWQHLHPGLIVSIGDGALQFEVEAVGTDGVSARALSSGVLRGRPGIHIPSALVQLESPTPADFDVLAAAVAAGVDAVAVSFVNHPADVHAVRAAAPDQLIIAKIETTAAVAELDAIIAVSDAVMVARGDLGLEFPLGEVPFLQRRIIRAATAAARPVITATQMLESMTSSHVPTRAEAADVASAIMDGTSAVMLSGETAVGVDPRNAVKTMSALAERADREVRQRESLPLPATGSSQTAASTHAVSEAAHRIAAQTGAVAVIGLTESGFTARALARWRSPLPLIAAVHDHRVARQLRLSWGVQPVVVSAVETQAVLAELVDRGVVDEGVLVVVVAGVPGARASDTVRVCVTPLRSS